MNFTINYDRHSFNYVEMIISYLVRTQMFEYMGCRLTLARGVNLFYAQMIQLVYILIVISFSFFEQPLH